MLTHWAYDVTVAAMATAAAMSFWWIGLYALAPSDHRPMISGWEPWAIAAALAVAVTVMVWAIGSPPL